MNDNFQYEKETAAGKRKHRFYRQYGKRAADILFSSVAIILLSPVIGVLALLVRIKHGSPVFFCPTRPGKDEKIFKLYKFRTMSNARDKDGVLLPEKKRITKFGKFLRSSSLDELPELFNIFIGDMSFVGPRPLPMKYLPYYSTQQRVRHEVRPGLTGLAQISGRNNLPWNERYGKDLEYIEKLSLFYDISIIVKTAIKVIKRSDVIVPGDTTFYQFDTYKVLEEQGEPVAPDDVRSAREIGGDFWIDASESARSGARENELLPPAEDGTYTVSGRAAIELAIRDILSKKTVRRACVPSYCSFAMLQPFIKNDIAYDFYDVVWNGERFVYDIGNAKKYDLALVTSYFGLGREELDGTVAALRAAGCIVIEDITHSLLSDAACSAGADYYVASLRKWFDIPTGGWLGKREGSLAVRAGKDSADVGEKPLEAMKSKFAYISGASDEKKDYLCAFTSFESDLVQLDPEIGIDDLSAQRIKRLNPEEIKTRRRENARTLLSALCDVEGVRSLYRKSDLEKIVPLYFPIIVDGGKRDELQAFLRERGIYCPVTWAERMGAKAGIRRTELSLICDQRYDERDMTATAGTIKSFFGAQV